MKLFHKRGRGGLKREKDGVEEEEEEQMGKVVELKKIMVLYNICHCVVLAGVFLENIYGTNSQAQVN